MHEENMELLAEEAKRIVRQQIALLEDMKAAADVVSERPKERETFTQEGIPEDLEVLRGELTKLEGLQMVLAVVGTMKAGKSTAINAIVGTEVLPSRNRPMTALPTLIRHTPGLVEPVLRVENNGPLAELLERLRRDSRVKELERDVELGSLAGRVSSAEPVRTRYEGTTAIYEFLEVLNDLVRLCREVDEEFPFQDYDEVHELPVVEVEFAHLRELERSQGNLVLLDTPGPNESGQPRLKQMLREQLRKASAVLLVLDYTQLKSEADSQVRNELREIARMTGDRVYVMVNKFDQKDRNSDDEDEVKRLVADDLMSGQDGSLVAEDGVFPVSALQAYLANRAICEVGRTGRLPAASAQPWVEDFGEQAFGRRWEQQVGDPEAVLEYAGELWDDSRFDEPLEKVIRAAHAEAGRLALKSANDKLADYSDRVSNFSSVRMNALNESIDEINRTLEGLEEDKTKLADMQDGARKRLAAIAEEALKDLDERMKLLKRACGRKMDEYFADGRALQRKAYEELEDARDSFLDRLFLRFAFVRPMDRERDFIPDDDVIVLRDQAIAKELVLKIDRSVRTVQDEFNTAVRECVGDAARTFRTNVRRTKAELGRELRDLGSRMQGQGFELKLRLPPVRTGAFPELAQDVFDQMLDERDYTVRRRRHKSTLGGFICSLFGTTVLGTEEYEDTEKRYVIDIPQARTAVMGGIDASFGQLDMLLKAKVEDPLQEATDGLFHAARGHVERIRGDLIRSRRDAELDAGTKQDLVDRLRGFASRGQVIAQDAEGLRGDLN